MTARKPKDQLQKRGRKSGFRSEFIRIAFIAAKYGAIEEEIARDLGVSRSTFNRWKELSPEFRDALKTAKAAADDRVARSLYHRAIGYNYNAVKIMTRAIGGGESEIVQVPYVEHCPPDVTAQIFFLKNRRPDLWRDVHNIEAEMGHYVIADHELTEEEWIKLHASNAEQLELEAKAIESDANDRESKS
jgi:hypothetical protein